MLSRINRCVCTRCTYQRSPYVESHARCGSAMWQKKYFLHNPYKSILATPERRARTPDSRCKEVLDVQRAKQPTSRQTSSHRAARAHNFSAHRSLAMQVCIPQQRRPVMTLRLPTCAHAERTPRMATKMDPRLCGWRAPLPEWLWWNEGN